MSSQAVLPSPLNLDQLNQQNNSHSLSSPSYLLKKPAFSSPRRNSLSISSPIEDQPLNALELEAIAVVHELRSLVKDLYVSDKLPRTPDLIYLNLTTLEGHPFCVELTSMKGWRVTSIRHDCMNGDVAHLDLHIRYFDTMHNLMEHVSDEYARKMDEIRASNPVVNNNEKTEPEVTNECTEVDQESQTFT